MRRTYRRGRRVTLRSHRYRVGAMRGLTSIPVRFRGRRR